tara:strand:- start:1010 stop:1222 length:213 start_codon:yes stop_codon:yes gene_type:complete
MNKIDFSLYHFSFTNNADAVNLLIFGRDMETWLIYTLFFLGVTLLSFIGTWLAGILMNKNPVSSVKQPLE